MATSDTAPRYTSGELHRYFAATLGDPHDAAAAVIASRYATVEIVADTLGSCSAADPERTFTRDAWLAAAASPLTDPGDLYEWVLTEPMLADTAAANPELGPDRVAELWSTTRNPALLSNPHIGATLLRGHADQHPRRVGANPSAPADVLRSCHLLGLFFRPMVVRNPACPRDLLNEAFTSGTSMFLFAVSNQALTLAELNAMRAVELDALAADPGHPRGRLNVLERVIDRHLVTVDPHSVRTLRYDHGHGDDIIARGAVGHLDVIDPLAEAILAEDDTADAATALLAGGFDGTVGELLDCAAGVTMS